MDRSAVKAFVDHELEPLMSRLGIPHWRIVVAYEPSPVDDNGLCRNGECIRLVDYNSARIVLNPEAFANESEIHATLLHELFHVVASPFDVFANAVKALQLNDDVQRVLESVLTHASERMVIHLRRMYLGLTAPADDPETPSRPQPD